jgi:predicted enzyme related to lactoylglutathione lyase
MADPVHHVTFDALDPYALGTFWAQAVGGRVQDDDEPGDPAVLVTYGGTPLLFEQVPDGKTVKNRVHLDLVPELPRAQEVERLLALGATVLHDRTRPDGSGWVVMADPEGNELCVERSRAERGETGVDTGEREFPALHAADERTMLDAMLDWYRDGVVAKVDGMAQHDATSPLRSGTTAAGVVKHLAFVEDHWCTRVVAGQPIPEPWASAPFDDDPDWEFHSASGEPLADSVALYREACARSRVATAGTDLDSTTVQASGRVVSLRFVLLHLVEETARHLGHLDVLRELADGSTGE